ncbi:hypothetical protein [Paludibacter sp.]|uniref:hypothetical protein n=1 Tax=Paludibacter sp. TaxID=1898105 RepID=UPI0025E31587|nr:hypothetical protein [Paludibacter sp.]
MAKTNNYQKLLADYDKHCLLIARATSIDINEKHADKLSRIKFNEKDYIRWFEYYFPNYAKKKSAWFHKKLAKAICDNKQIKALMEAYRSSGKSVHIDLGIPLYLYLVKGELHYMLLIGQTDKKAKKLLSGIQAQLRYNHRIINDYGNKYSNGDWAEGEFLTTDGVRFSSLGFGSDPRGAREDAERPDYIVVDDCDSKKHLKNNEIMSEALDFITEDVWGCFDAEDDAVERFVYANNNFHKNSLTNRLVEYFKHKIKEGKEKGRVHNFFHLRVDAVKDMNTFEPNWPEKTTAQYWRNKYEDMPYRSFMREYMNTHIEEGKVFKAEWWQWTKILPYHKYDAIIFYGDLSWKDAACHKSMVCLGKIGRQFHILHVFFRQTSRTQMAQWLYDLYEDKHLSKENIQYMFEGMFAMSEFQNDFDEEGDVRGYYIPIVPSNRAKGDKDDRIEGISGFFERRNVYANEAEKDNSDMVLAKDTYLAFEKGASIPKDFLDALHGAFTEVNVATFVGNFDIQSTSRSSTRKRYF